MKHRRLGAVLFLAALTFCLNILPALANQAMVAEVCGGGWDWWAGGVILGVALAATGVGAVGCIVACAYYGA